MSIVKEFREFAVKGNVVDMAVGIIIGAAFGKIVSSLVADVVTPPLGYVIGGVDFTKLAWTMPVLVEGKEPATLRYGVFLQSLQPDADPVALTRREGRAFTAAHEDRVRRLLGDRPHVAGLPRPPLAANEVVRRRARRADREHLPGPHEVVERTEGLLEIDAGIQAVQLVEVDAVGVEAAQRLLAGLQDPPA